MFNSEILIVEAKCRSHVFWEAYYIYIWLKLIWKFSFGALHESLTMLTLSSCFSTLFSALLQRSLKNYELGILLSALNSGTSQGTLKKKIQRALIASNIAQEFHAVLQCKSWRIWNNYNKEGWEVMLSTENFTPSRINITAVHVDIAAEIIKSKKECACI